MSGAQFQMLLAGAPLEPVNLLLNTIGGIGDASGTYVVPSRRSMVVLCFGAQTNPASEASACTISGHAAVQVANNGITNNTESMWAAMVDPGDPNTWSVTISNVFSSRCRAHVYTSNAGRINVTDIDEASDPTPTPFDVGKGGSILGAFNSQGAGVPSSTWTVVTEDNDAGANQHGYHVAHADYVDAAANQSPTISLTGSSGFAGVWAVFEP